MYNVFRIYDIKALEDVFEKERNLYVKASVFYFHHLHIKSIKCMCN